MTEQTTSKKITVGLILSWIFGILFALTGFISVFSEPIPGLVMLIMAAVLLPPVVKLIEQKSSFKLTRTIKAVIIIVSLIIFGATIDTSTTQQDDQKVTEADQQNIANNEEQPQTETNGQADDEEKTETIPVLFDVSALLDKNISYFAPAFSEPVNENPEPTDIAIQTGVETWTKSFEKDGYLIDVTYNINSGKVTEIFLSKGTYDMPLEETWITKNEVNDLLKRGNISKDSTGYYYRFMWPIQDKSKYTGVKVQKEPFTGFEGDQLCNGYPEC